MQGKSWSASTLRRHELGLCFLQALETGWMALYCWHFHFNWGTSLNMLLGDRTQSGWLSLTATLCLPVPLRSDRGISLCHTGNVTGEGNQLWPLWRVDLLKWHEKPCWDQGGKRVWCLSKSCRGLPGSGQAVACLHCMTGQHATAPPLHPEHIPFGRLAELQQLLHWVMRY